jgi:leucyl-tRNA---protein transferase
MISLFTFTTPPHPCSYLPDRTASLQYELYAELSPSEYETLMHAGWRRFGRSAFRPVCDACDECRPLRINVAEFRANQSQKRAWKANLGEIELRIGAPCVTDEKLELYDRYHAYQADHVGWREHSPQDAEGYTESFIEQPFAIQEWTYWLQGELVGVGYVDDLSSGPSAIYFFYAPEHRERSLGTFNVLSTIEYAKARQRPWVYLGYHVEGCRSLEYKANFKPNERRTPDGAWVPYR